MNETTRAVIRCEVAQRREALGAAFKAGTLTPAQDVRLRQEIIDLSAALGITPDFDHAPGDINLTHGEALHIHNA